MQSKTGRIERTRQNDKLSPRPLSIADGDMSKGGYNVPEWVSNAFAPWRAIPNIRDEISPWRIQKINEERGDSDFAHYRGLLLPLFGPQVRGSVG